MDIKLKKVLRRINQQKYYEKNFEYYQIYQKFHYSINKHHRLRTAKKRYYKKTYNRDVFFIKPPENYEEYMKKQGFKIKFC